MRRFVKLVAPVFLLLPLATAFMGSRGASSIDFNLGPGDSPYLVGFLPAYEIDEKLATHWTTYDALVELPLSVEGGPVHAEYRYARIFPETAQVEIDLAGTTIDRFSCRGGAYEVRRGSLAAVDGPLTLAVRADSHERQNMGLKLDWVRFELGDRSRLRLTGWARLQPVALTLLLVGILTLAGFEVARAASLVAPAAVALGAGLLVDPWLVHRLLHGLTLALVLFALGVVGVGRFLLSRGRADRATVRWVVFFMLLAFVGRALLVNHPDFYYPDLRTHARLVGFVRDAGLAFLVSPSDVIAEHSVWRTGAYGQTYAFPYTPAFHLPFALFDVGYDTLVTALKLAGAAISTVPIALVWAFARRFRLPSPVPAVAAVLMIIIPTYASRLSFAFLPALFGHAVDLAFLYWLFRCLPRIGEGRKWLVGALLVAACQLAYVSGVINISLYVFVLAVLTFFLDDRRNGLRVLGMGIVGGVIAFVVFYRDFLPMVIDLVPRMLGGVSGVESRYPIRGWLEMTGNRTYEFFGLWYPGLAAFGLALMFVRSSRVPRLVFGAWLTTYFLLLLGRAKIPDIFLHGHETLFLTPLVCLASAVVLAELFHRGGLRRVLGGALLAGLTVVGLTEQWQFFVDQMRNAL